MFFVCFFFFGLQKEFNDYIHGPLSVFRTSFAYSGLDPTEPYFQDTNASVHLDTSDATFVDIIHTDGHPFNTKLGTYHC